MADKLVNLKVNVEQTGDAGQKLTNAADSAQKMNEQMKQAMGQLDVTYSSAIEKLKNEIERVRSVQKFESTEYGQSLKEEKARLQSELDSMTGKKQGIGSSITSFGTGLAGAAIGIGGPPLAAMAIERVANKVADSFNIVNNSSMNNAQKNEELAKSIIPLYSSFAKLRDAIDGTTEKIRRAGQREETTRADLSYGFALSNQAIGMERQVYTSQARADSFIANPLEVYRGGDFNRLSVSGEVEYNEYQARLRGRDELVRAERARDAAASTASGSARQFRDAERFSENAESNLDSALRERDRVRRRENGGRRDAGARAEAASSVVVQTEASENRRNNLIEARTRMMQDQLSLQEAEARVQEARINQERIELDLLKQKEQRMMNTQQRLGGMTRGSFEMNLQAAQTLRRVGIENATPEMIQMAQQISPDFVRRLSIQNGGARARRVQEVLGVENVGNDFNDNLENVQVQIEERTRGIRIDVDFNERNLADRLSKIVSDALFASISELRQRIVEGDRVTKEHQWQRNANQG